MRERGEPMGGPRRCVATLAALAACLSLPCAGAWAQTAVPSVASVREVPDHSALRCGERTPTEFPASCGRLDQLLNAGLFDAAVMNRPERRRFAAATEARLSQAVFESSAPRSATIQTWRELAAVVAASLERASRQADGKSAYVLRVMEELDPVKRGEFRDSELRAVSAQEAEPFLARVWVLLGRADMAHSDYPGFAAEAARQSARLSAWSRATMTTQEFFSAFDKILDELGPGLPKPPRPEPLSALSAAARRNVAAALERAAPAADPQGDGGAFDRRRRTRIYENGAPAGGRLAVPAQVPGVAPAAPAVSSSKSPGRDAAREVPVPILKAQTDARDFYASSPLDEGVLAAASPAARLRMLRFFMDGLRDEWPRADPWADTRWRDLIRIFAAAPDPGSFDYLYYRLTKAQLNLLYSSPSIHEDFRALVKRHHAPRPGDWDGYGKYVDAVAKTRTSGRNKLDFLVDGDRVLPVFFAEVEKAQVSIHLEVYQLEAMMSREDYEKRKTLLNGRAPVKQDFADGLSDVGWLLADKLREKVKQHVHVHILLDEHGTEGDAGVTTPFVKELVERLIDAGVELHVRAAPKTLRHLDHRKLFVFDGRVAFVGGMNIGHHYQVAWHDQQTRLEGPVVRKLQWAFVQQWEAEHRPDGHANHADDEKIDETVEQLFPPLPDDAEQAGPPGTEVRVLLHDGGEQDHNIKASYLRAIGASQKYIHIANPYFGDEQIVNALCAAASRGVDVSIILPEENDMGIMKSTARYYYARLIKAGVHVYEFHGDPARPQMAHEKAAVIDGLWTTFGSSNLDARSLAFNDEINVVTLDENVARQVEDRLFMPDLSADRSREIKDYRPTLKDLLAHFVNDTLRL